MSPAYIILTSKPGQFHTELGQQLVQVEAYDYVAQGRNRAHFVIAQLSGEIKIRVVDEGVPPAVNEVPSKFFPKFDSLESARKELGQLAHSPSGQSRLVKL
jgi:hypothetical protein